MIKILYIVTLSDRGGAQRYVADLATNLPRDHYQVAVAAGGNGPLFAQLSDRGITTYQLKRLVRAINPIKDYAAYVELKNLVRRVNPDVVHLNSSKAGVIGSIAAAHAGVPKIVYTVHGFAFNEAVAAWKKWLYWLAEKYFVRYKHALIFISEFDRRTSASLGLPNQKQLVTIHNGVNPPALLQRPPARQALGLPADKVIIGSIANFYPTKDLVTMVRAVGIISQQQPDIHFALIGDGIERHALEAEIKRLELVDRVTLCGQHPQPGRYLSAFDVYVCSSVKEGFPFSILEAMAAGLPVVSTNVGGIPEMITNGGTGVLVEPKNPPALADAITSLLSDKNRADRLGRQAQQEVREKFSLERMVKETEKVYHLSSRTPARHA